ncbi:MAG: threonine synthase [Oscillospiraceae bacterium]|jgi:threonine synthase|nr:threonine synthase [Oscillospiraceae bacterium]
MLVSTRGGAKVTASRAILEGIAPDGGLYAPETLPHFTLQQIEALAPLPYADRARHILGALLDDYDDQELQPICEAAYGARFEKSDPAPLHTLNPQTHLLELFHGPTLAFKDMALQIMPRLLALAARKNGMDKEICILVATSGDTGKAALEGFCDVPGTRCVVFYPKDGVSRAQYLQMATQEGANTHVVAVHGNFDDAQSGVKRIFSDAAFVEKMAARGRALTSANSINYGRLAPQVVYYFSAYADLLARGAIQPGQTVHAVVPTGNFGNILAAYYARRMGLPLGKLLCASNANRVLADFIQTGVYDINRPFYRTSSPSMDILISSNLERYLFELADHDPAKVNDWMQALQLDRHYALDGATLLRLHEAMVGGWVSDGEAMENIRLACQAANTLIDTHTAVGMALLNRYRTTTGDRTPAIVVATASPYKFGRAVARAMDLPDKSDFACCRRLARLLGQPVPESIARLEHAVVRHDTTCAPEEMAETLLNLF